jgi:hypothetical protein
LTYSGTGIYWKHVETTGQYDATKILQRKIDVPIDRSDMPWYSGFVSERQKQSARTQNDGGYPDLSVVDEVVNFSSDFGF